MRDNLDQNHKDKAELYIGSCIETINSFIDYDEWYNKKNKIFRFPKTKAHENCLDRCGGLITAHNRQLIFAAGMLNVKKYLELKKEREELQARYESIVISVSQYFWDFVIRMKKDGDYFYVWNYREEKKIGSKRPPNIEDMGHGGLDIQCVTQIYNDLGSISLSYDKRKFGKDNFRYMSNTLLKIMYNKENENFSKRVDGTFDNPKFMKKKKYNGGSIRWISLCDWDERVFANAHKQLRNKVSIKNALPYCEFLYYKEKRFGNFLLTK